MDDLFKIYIARLKEGIEEHLAESFDPSFMAVIERDLVFKVPIHLKAHAAMADDNLVFRFCVDTEATMPCAICSQQVQVKIAINNFFHTENQEDIRGGIFNFKEILRETILLEIPLIIECHGGNCPERADMVKYMRKNKMDEEKEFYHPFTDL